MAVSWVAWEFIRTRQLLAEWSSRCTGTVACIWVRTSPTVCTCWPTDRNVTVLIPVVPPAPTTSVVIVIFCIAACTTSRTPPQELGTTISGVSTSSSRYCIVMSGPSVYRFLVQGEYGYNHQSDNNCVCHFLRVKVLYKKVFRQKV